jgi:hypothetical protein
LQRIDTKHQSKLDRAKGFSYIRKVKRELRNLIGEFKLGSPFRHDLMVKSFFIRRVLLYLRGNEESWFEKEKKRRKDDVFSFSLNESHGGEKQCT